MSDISSYVESRKRRDPEFAREYDRLEPEYAAIRAAAEPRAASGMTLEELARITGMKESNLSRVECGRVVPTIRTLSRIAEGLGKRLEIDFV